MAKTFRFLIPLLICAIFLFLLLFPTNAVTSARSGLMLWFQVILPTLLPFMILSRLLVETNAISGLTFLFAGPFKKLLGLSKSGTFVVMTGFLCGYPMGAKLTADLYLHGQLTKTEAGYLLSFCNNLSPMFISSFLNLSCLEAPALLSLLFLLIYGVPIFFALITQPLYRRTVSSKRTAVSPDASTSVLNFNIVDTAIMDGFTQITKLGGYIILFSIISGMFLTLSLPNRLLALITGLVEVTTGINYISAQQFSLELRLLYCIPICVFGGCSGLMQTYSMIKETGLPFSLYFYSKAAQTILSFIVTWMFISICIN